MASPPLANAARPRASVWAYLLALVPAATEFMESGHWPSTPRQLATEFFLGLLVLALVWTLLRQADRLHALAESDALTGLWNAGRFHRDLRDEATRALRHGSALSLAFLDLDGFKGVNDRFGHARGDEVLARVGRILRAGLRGIDRAYRVGGDEFAVLLQATPGVEAEGVVTRLLDEVRQGPDGLAAVGAGISGGLVELLPKESAPDFLKRADTLLYSAKHAGKDRVLVK